MGNYYDHPSGYVVPRVTAITGQLHKPALIYGAVNRVCDYILEQMASVDSSNGFFDYHLSHGGVEKIIEKARKNALIEWSKAADVGTQVHQCIENGLQCGFENITNIINSYPPAVKNAVMAFITWIDTQGTWETVKLEERVYGKRYAGTFDWLVKLDNELWLIDFKSSKAIYDEYRWQVAAYSIAYSENIDRIGILRLDKDTGLPEFIETTDTRDEDFDIFEALCEVYWRRNRWRGKP